MESILKHYDNDRFERSKALSIIDYNLSGGKNIRLNAYLKTLGLLNHEINENDKEIGYCIEIFQSFFLIIDDVCDKSEMRRGKLCWYKIVKFEAIRNAYFLKSAMYKILKNSTNPIIFREVAKLFSKIMLITSLGQVQDTIKKTIKNEADCRYFYSFNFYREIVHSKTSNYTVFLPLASALLVSNKIIPGNLHSFSMDVGFYMQFQDDYLNFFPEKAGKSGTDLEEAKVTWYLCKYVENTKDLSDFMEYLETRKYEKIWPKIKKEIEKYDDDEKRFVTSICEKWGDEFDGYFNIMKNLLFKRVN